jgi:hypothetical protein
MMTPTPKSWISLSLLVALSTSTAAWAAKSPRVPEVYSATETENTVAHPLAVNPSARKLMNTPTPSSSQAHSIARQQLAGQAAPHQTAPAYDPVPSDQKDSMSRRLKLVDMLIHRYGRAYDYRMHTVRELEAVLAQLDGAAAPTHASSEPAPAPAPRIAPVETAPATLPTPSEADEVQGDAAAHDDM